MLIMLKIFRFPNLCVQHITRRKAADVLAQRILDSIALDKKIDTGDFKNKIDLTGLIHNPFMPSLLPQLFVCVHF